MAKKTGLTNSVTLGKRKISSTQKGGLNIQKVNKGVENIHKDKQKNIRLSIDVPENIYLKLKAKTIQDRRTVRGYVLGLIEKDLK